MIFAVLIVLAIDFPVVLLMRCRGVHQRERQRDKPWLFRHHEYGYLKLCLLG